MRHQHYFAAGSVRPASSIVCPPFGTEPFHWLVWKPCAPSGPRMRKRWPHDGGIRDFETSSMAFLTNRSSSTLRGNAASGHHVVVSSHALSETSFEISFQKTGSLSCPTHQAVSRA